MKHNATDLEALSALNKRFIHNFVTNDVASHDAMVLVGAVGVPSPRRLAAAD